MVTRRELTKAYAREYQRASKKAKEVMLDELWAAMGWSRVNARRAIRQALARKAVPCNSHASRDRGSTHMTR